MNTFLIIFVLFCSLVTFYLCKNRNAWDILFFNTTLATTTLFIIGIIAQNEKVWLSIVTVLGVVATGDKIVSFFLKGKNK